MESFLLTNRRGGFLLLSSVPYSKYHGACFRQGDDVFKVIEDIRLDKPSFRDIVYHMWMSERQHQDVSESFFMPLGRDAIVYELDREASFSLILDCKHLYDSRMWGRNYEIYEDGDIVVIRFTKKTDSREDQTHGYEEKTIYACFRKTGLVYTVNDRWENTHYEYDASRGTQPAERYVYNAVNIKGSRLIVCYGTDLSEAKEQLSYVESYLDKLKSEAQRHTVTLLGKGITSDHEINLAYLSSLHAVDQLMIDDEGKTNMYAGIPWFFQFWSRDELTSLGSLTLTGRYEEAITVLRKYLQNITEDGRIPNRLPGSELGSIDSIGWLVFRFSQLRKKLMDSGRLDEIMSDEVFRDMCNRIEIAINRFTVSNTKDQLVHNKKNETWMDTDFNGEDGREGARIEMQAMLLKSYSFLYEITGNYKYRRSEEDLKRKVREEFFRDNTLADGLGDFTVRPNVFIAAFIYPELLTKDEWTKVFETAIERLWCDWGGLSTIDKESHLFQEYYTGEDNRSYHRGDSWYYINCIAAIALHRINPARFKDFIAAIVTSSTKEILYHGIIGHHAEVSSAKEMTSSGCQAQLWSSAMYIELLHELA